MYSVVTASPQDVLLVCVPQTADQSSLSQSTPNTQKLYPTTLDPWNVSTTFVTMTTRISDITVLRCHLTLSQCEMTATLTAFLLANMHKA